jgi:hypothetical protein
VVIETILGRLLGWIPAPWSGVRIGSEGKAHLCTFGHSPVYMVGPGVPDPPPDPPHVDVDLRLWSRSGHRTTVRGAMAESAGQALAPIGYPGFRDITLEPGAPPVKSTIVLRPPTGEGMRAQAGDRLRLSLAFTQGRGRRLTFHIVPERN